MIARITTGTETPKRRRAIRANSNAEAAWTNRNSYGRSGRSALARSAASELVFWLDAIHTGAPVGSNLRRSCSRTSARVRTVTRALGAPLGSTRPAPRIPNTTNPTPIAAAAAMGRTLVDIAQPVVKCQRLSTSLGPTPPADEMLGHAGSGWFGVAA